MEPARPFRKIAAALDFGEADAEVLSRAAGLAAANRCPLLLVHCVESAGAAAMGGEITDTESQKDLDRLRRYTIVLGKHDIQAEAEAGFGHPVRVLPEIIKRHGVELLVVGAHGHKGLSDWLYGSTIDEAAASPEHLGPRRRAGRLSASIHKYGSIRVPLHPPRLRSAPSPYLPVRLGRAPCRMRRIDPLGALPFL